MGQLPLLCFVMVRDSIRGVCFVMARDGIAGGPIVFNMLCHGQGWYSWWASCPHYALSWLGIVSEVYALSWLRMVSEEVGLLSSICFVMVRDGIHI